MIGAITVVHSIRPNHNDVEGHIVAEVNGSGGITILAVLPLFPVGAHIDGFAAGRLQLPAAVFQIIASLFHAVPGGHIDTIISDIRKITHAIDGDDAVAVGIGFLFAFNNGVQLAFVSSYAEAAGFGHAGMFFAVQAVFSALSRVLLSKLTSRHTVSFATTIAGVFLILFSLALGLGKNLLHFYLASAFFGIGYGTLLPVTQSVSITRTPESRRASGSSTYGLGIQLAFAVSGTAGGLIADRFGYAAMFLSLIVPSMAAMLLGLWKGNFPVSPAAGGGDMNGTNDPGNG